MRRRVMAFLTALAALAVCAPEVSHAVSAFARQYGMDCKTCHDVIPHRNEFGQAFEKNGYIWPEGVRIEKAVREDYLDISGIMGSIPLAMTLTHTFGYDRDADTDKVGSDSLAQLHVAGSIGDRIGFFSHNVLSSGEMAAVLKLLPEQDVSLRLGKLTPTLSIRKPNQNYTTFTPSNLVFSVLGEPALGAVRDALELDATVLRRGHVALGVVNRGKQDDMEFYASALYKVGGADLKGAEPEFDLDGEESVWDHLALTFNAYGYAGYTELTDTRYFRWGGEAEALYRKLTVLVGGVGGHDETDGGDGLKIDTAIVHGEVDYRLLSELMCALRAESEMVGNAPYGDLVRVTGALNWIVYQNAILRLEGVFEDDDAKARTKGFLTLMLHI